MGSKNCITHCGYYKSDMVSYYDHYETICLDNIKGAPMIPELHPLRCETCNKATSKILENGAIRCKGDYLSPDYVRFISEKGCASHSAAKSDAVLEIKILETKLSECQRGREALRASIAQATIELSKLERKLAELRQQKEPVNRNEKHC